MLHHFRFANHQCVLIDPKGDSVRFDNIPGADGALPKVQVDEGFRSRLQSCEEWNPTESIDRLQTGETGAEADNREETS